MANLPVYEMVINPDEASEVEVSFVALVDKPAIERNFLAFNSKELNFKTDEEKRIISGPAMVAESLIYRRDDNGEYNVFFSAQTIRQIAEKFFKKDYHKNLNLFHDPSLSLEGVTIFESFISDKERGIQPMKGFEDLPDGSWFISAKIENEAVWQKIKSGEVKGFSVEGIFSYQKKEKKNSLSEILNRTLENESHLEESEIMAFEQILNKLKEKFLGEPAATPPAAPPTNNQLAKDYQLKDGTPVMVDRLEVGGMVMVGDAPAPAGEHELADGTKIVVGEGGVITEVVAKQDETPNFETQFSDINQKFTAFEQRFTEQTNTINQLTQSLQTQNESLSSLVQIVEKLAETPTADPVEPVKNGFSSDKIKSKEEARQELVSIFKKIKK